MDIKRLRELCDKATPDEFIAAARTALPEALDEIGRLRKCLLEVRVLISGAYYQDDITEIKELIGEALQGGVRR